jgi:hypothetical protein
MPPLTPELVNQYIEKAEAVAKSKTDRLAVQLASDLNSPPQWNWQGSFRRRNPYKEPGQESEAEREVGSWRDLALKEIHIAQHERGPLGKWGL